MHRETLDILPSRNISLSLERRHDKSEDGIRITEWVSEVQGVRGSHGCDIGFGCAELILVSKRFNFLLSIVVLR